MTLKGLLSRQILGAFVVVFLVTVIGVAAANGTFNPSAIDVVTEMHYSTTTVTSGSSTYVSTQTLTPYETLKTTTEWGTGSYTVTMTVTTSCNSRGFGDNDGCQKSVTTTTETTADYYMPLAMYYTATTNAPLFRQMTPIVILPPNPHDSSYVETIGQYSSVSLKIVSNSTAYHDLGFYYIFQSLGSLNAFLAAGGSHTVTVIGSGFVVSLWVNPGALTWGPGPAPPTEVITSTKGFASGFSGSIGTVTVSSSTPFHMTTAAGSCSAGGTYTIPQLITVCGIPSSTPFALWIGITSTSVGTTAATVSAIYSSPYP